MGFFSWIILGLIAGLIGKAVVKDTGVTGWATLGVGVLGALLGGGIGALFGFEMDRFFSIGSWAFAILGAVVVLVFYRYLALNFLQQKEPKGAGDHEKLT